MHRFRHLAYPLVLGFVLVVVPASADIIFDNFHTGSVPSFSPSAFSNTAVYLAVANTATRSAAKFTVTGASYARPLVVVR